MVNPTSKNVITLSKLAKELGMNKSHLHYWVQRGLIAPDYKLSNVYAFSKTAVIARINRINALRGKGFTLDEISARLKK